MNEITRNRILRKLENIPDEVLYEVIDFIDFIEKRHGSGVSRPSPFQRIAEGFEDVLRAGRVPVAAIKGTMQVVDAAGRVMDGISAAGQTVVSEVQKAAEGEVESDAPQVEHGTEDPSEAAEAQDDDGRTDAGPTA